MPDADAKCETGPHLFSYVFRGCCYAGQPVEQSAARQAQQPNAAQQHSRATLQQDQQSVAALLNTGRAGGAATGYVLRDDTQAFITGLGHMAGNPDEKKRVMTHTCWFAFWS